MSEYSAKSPTPMVNSDDILNGSFGAHIDQYLNKQPFDGPDGYVLRRISYRTAGDTATLNVDDSTTTTDIATISGEILMTFKMDELCRGMVDVSALSGLTVGQRRTSYINNDQDQVSNDLERPAAISNECQLQKGDIPLGAILVLEDARSEDNQDGTLFAGMAPVDTNDHVFDTDDALKYGVFPSLSSSLTHILQTSLSKSYIGGAAKTKRLAVASRNLNTSVPIRFNNEVPAKVVDSAGAASFGGDAATPVHCIGMTGIKLDDVPSVFANLHIYALCGPRTSGLTHPEVDYNFSVKDCLKLGASTGHVHYAL